MIEMLKIGQEFHWNMVITIDIMNKFREISLDDNPIHIDPNYSKLYGFRNIVCYGNLLGLMISSLVGVEMRKYKVMLISQNILYRHPFHPGDKIQLLGIMENISIALKVAELKLTFTNGKKVTIAQGKCQVKEMVEIKI
ncbi:MAG: MaoC/PaaZ C-terminal domain-containing protein [Pseudomonadota bacterium]